MRPGALQGHGTGFSDRSLPLQGLSTDDGKRLFSKAPHSRAMHSPSQKESRS